MQAENQSLSKHERIKSKKRISALFTTGTKIHRPPLLVVCQIVPRSGEEAACKMAISVPKRNFKRAVDRNQIKRLTREAYRTHKLHLDLPSDQTLLLFYIFVGKRMPNSSEVKRTLVNVNKKVLKWLRTDSKAHKSLDKS